MYIPGFGNHHQTQAVQGALPPNQNSPQISPMGLFAEQISGTAFTRPRHQNLHTWMYRILPTAAQGAYSRYAHDLIKPFATEQSPNASRWSPPTFTSHTKTDFIEGLLHIAGSHLVNAFLFHCNISMHKKYFANNDGELLIIPYKGELLLHTEMGVLMLRPGIIAVVPRGIKFKVELVSAEAFGYMAENAGNPLTLPNLGLIGANALANPRHFNYPTAAFEQGIKECQILCKYQNKLWVAKMDHSPLNVVAWHGNYAPYSYDLSLFNTINTVSFDHPDPSIFTVLTSESDTPGVANLDFVIFPPRWMVAEHTFRPPYFHRNYMNELMGLIQGEYDAKKEGFLPGGISIHNCMTGHGPDLATYENSIKQTLKPEQYKNTLAFMLETRDNWLITDEAMNSPHKQHDYLDCWKGFIPTFTV